MLKWHGGRIQIKIIPDDPLFISKEYGTFKFSNFKLEICRTSESKENVQIILANSSKAIRCCIFSIIPFKLTLNVKYSRGSVVQFKIATDEINSLHSSAYACII